LKSREISLRFHCFIELQNKSLKFPLQQSSNNIMQKIIKKIIASIRSIGVTGTLIKLSKHLFNKMFRDQKIEEKIFSFQNIEDRFTAIYRNNLWGNFESVSGNGSTLEGTKNLRSKLPELFEKFSIKTIFDAPCGDFNWMRHFLEKSKVNYIGGDIVRPLIDEHNANFQNASTKFLHVDITKDKLPAADLMICRDCLFHLSYNDTKLFLQNFIDSKILYLLTTTYINQGEFSNQDIKTGGFRLIDLLSAPYHFEENVLYRIEDTIPNETPREMCLWSREQIISAMEKFNRN